MYTDRFALQTYSETQGHNFKLTATYADVNADSYDALVIPGGRAPEYLSADESVLHLVKKFADSKRLVASICHGPLVLAAADVLKGLECTGFAPVKPVVIAAGGIWKEAPCVQDGNLVTATAWPDNPEFLKLIIKALGGKIHGSGKKILMLCGVCPIGKRKKLRKLGDSLH
jgi:D-lactate dehydratase